MNRRLMILDSTLREGEQTPGVYFPIHIKIAIARFLTEIGIDIIEAGHPVVTPKIKEAVATLAKSTGSHALIGAHSRSLKEDVDLALECGVNFIGIFYCVSRERLNHYGKNLKQVLRQISEVIGYLRERKKDIVIRYTPEDTVRSPWKNVIEAAAEAVRAGADIISIADTTGYMVPGTKRNMYDFVSRLRDELARLNLYPKIALHCHNDRGLALANALEGLRAGASVIDASVMGLGERAGIVDLASLLTVLTFDFEIKKNWNLKQLPPLYKMVSKFSGINIPVNFPITGKNAFTHCAGVHTQAVRENPIHYQSLPAEAFGRFPEVALDHMAGITSLKYSLEKIGKGDLEGDLLKEILSYVKEVGQTGRAVTSEELKLIVDYLEKKQRKEKNENRNFILLNKKRRETFNRRI